MSAINNIIDMRHIIAYEANLDLFQIFFAPVAQLDRVPDYESVGRRFESCRVRQKIQRVTANKAVTLFSLPVHLRSV